jgi:hypothetical protein
MIRLSLSLAFIMEWKWTAFLLVGLIFTPHIADYVRESHNVVLGERERLNFGQFPLHRHMGNHFS